MNPSTRQPGSTVILMVLIVAEIVSAFESVMMYTALTTMNRMYHDPVGVGWVITAFLLVGAASAAVGGRLGDIYGRGRILIAMLVAATIGSLISAWAPSLNWVIFGRAIQGLAGAIFPWSSVWHATTCRVIGWRSVSVICRPRRRSVRRLA